ncbi:putative porin [Geofilum sp. OHC36d9]|uniref:putative porin n=1 Tax=Geofilum sp. OHC36d9 TaxID=3458413 RepID=UPI004033C550
MKILFFSIALLLVFQVGGKAQISLQRDASAQNKSRGGGLSANQTGNEEGQPSAPVVAIKHVVKNWRVTNSGSLVDSVEVDTLSLGFQVYRPVSRIALANVQLGNIGAAWQPAMVSLLPVYNKFLFSRSLSDNFSTPDTWKYYNTRTPYTNIYYQYSPPKRRSEEVVKVLFTQNVNKNWNVGFNYDLISSIGKYEAQQVDNRHFRFFSSYSGEKYSILGDYVYNKTDHLENGGIIDESYIWNPNEKDVDMNEDIPVNFLNASNRIDNHQLYLNQTFDIGHVVVGRNDSTIDKMPLGTAIHSFHLSRYRRIYAVEDFSTYATNSFEDFYYPNIYNDSTATRDSVYYTSVENTFQLRFNEEANSLLRFGLRAFITNEVELFKYPGVPVTKGTLSVPPEYIMNDTVLTTTLLGGQIFKNVGRNFKWNAGARIYFQGYRAGDSELTGTLSSSFRIGKDTAGIYASGGAYLVTPDFFTERYYSNHFIWNNRFDQVQTLRVGGGIDVPTRRLKLSAETRSINKYVFWNQEALPEQTDEFIQVAEIQLYKHFQLWNLHSRNTVIYQLTNHDDILPLPEWTIYSSNYFQNTLFKVLFFQIGFDLRYNTDWYTPAYMPATGQFYAQRERKVGDYPMVDAFLNLHLKRARIFFKMDHVNEGYPSSRDYFHTIYYPMNPRGFHFGVSWNFYD